MRSAHTAVVLGLVALVLSGCVPAAPRPTPTPASATSAAPVFASDEEALAAAVAAYDAFLATSDQITAEGGADPDRVDAFIQGDAREAEKAGFADFRDKGYRSVGDIKVTNAIFQSRYGPSDGFDSIVIIYVCTDVTGVDVLDGTGASVVAPDRPATTPFEVVFGVRATAPPSLVITSKNVWSGVGVCP